MSSRDSLATNTRSRRSMRLKNDSKDEPSNPSKVTDIVPESVTVPTDSDNKNIEKGVEEKQPKAQTSQQNNKSSKQTKNSSTKVLSSQIEDEKPATENIPITDSCTTIQDDKNSALPNDNPVKETAQNISDNGQATATAGAGSTAPRRFSTRLTRRKKFDDEIIDSASPQLKPIRSVSMSLDDTQQPPQPNPPAIPGPFMPSIIVKLPQESSITPPVTIPTIPTPAPNEVSFSTKISATNRRVSESKDNLSLKVSKKRKKHLSNDTSDLEKVNQDRDDQKEAPHEIGPETEDDDPSYMPSDSEPGDDGARVTKGILKHPDSFKPKILSGITKRKASSRVKRNVRKKKNDDDYYDDDDDDDEYEQMEIDEKMNLSSKHRRTSFVKDPNRSSVSSKTSKHHVPKYASSFEDSDDEVIPPRTEQTDYPDFTKFDDHHMFWTPEDDLKLILNVCQGFGLQQIHTKVRFTQKFSFDDITERWNLMLYEHVTSNISIAAIRQLHPDIVGDIKRETLFNQNEIDVLKKIPSTVGFCEELFRRVLANFPDVFLDSREPKDLFKEWIELRNGDLLCDQVSARDTKLSVFSKEYSDHVQHTPAAPSSSSSSSLAISNSNLLNSSSYDHHHHHHYNLHHHHPNHHYNLHHHYDRDKKIEPKEETKDLCEEMHRYFNELVHRLRFLEAEVEQLLKLESTVSGIRDDPFGPGVFAEMKGCRVSFQIKTTEITVGRNTKRHSVDCDLMLEGYCSKVSRFQSVINLLPNGRFLIYNCGQTNIKVDSEWIHYQEAAELKHCSFLEFDNLGFVFKINYPFVVKELGLKHLEKKVFVPKCRPKV